MVSLGGSNKGKPTPPHTLGHTFKFKCYSPKVFKEIRSFFGIDTASYMLSVCGNYNYLEFISNSKSGQFFFYSHDGKYMIKTQTKTENKFMKSILPKYYEYISTHPHSLLVRILGMHRVKMYHLRRKVHFVIMTSVFDTPKKIHTIYDLKGSTVGREATEHEKKCGGVLKDLDLVKSGTKFQLGRKKKLFIEQLKLDTQFLAEMNIMDYSLLVGIHDRKQQENDSQSALDTNQHSNTPFRRTSNYVPPSAISNLHAKHEIQNEVPESHPRSNGSISCEANGSSLAEGGNSELGYDVAGDDGDELCNSLIDNDDDSLSSSEGGSDSEDLYSQDEGDSVVGDIINPGQRGTFFLGSNAINSRDNNKHTHHDRPTIAGPINNRINCNMSEKKSIFDSLLGRSVSKDSISGQNGGATSNSNNSVLSSSNLLSLSLPAVLIRNSSATSFGKRSVNSNDNPDRNINNTNISGTASRFLSKLTTSRSVDSLNSMDLEVARPATDSTSVHPWTMRSDTGINSSISKRVRLQANPDPNLKGDVDGKGDACDALTEDRGDDIYYVGVIDILQQYNMRKRVSILVAPNLPSNFIIANYLCRFL